MESLHQIGDVIADRYRITESLGKGGMGTTYRADDATRGQDVALKVVSLRQIDDWKVLELLDREAKVLENLDHPAIPCYIDYFQVDLPDDRLFYLVRELVEGESLGDLIQRGWRTDESTVKDITIQILKILNYLHRLSPPVIHRDIKPQNIIRQVDGQVYLVDFGAVQDIYRHTLSKSGTFVGTIGYMPPEQFRGQVTPASDLYALGATIIFLLTGRSPDELPQKRMRIDFRPHVHLSSSFEHWLDGMVAPAIEDRFQSAADALIALQQESRQPYVNALQPLDAHPNLARPKKPAGSRIQLQRTPNAIDIDIPPRGLSGDGMSFLFFAIFWNGFLVFWTTFAAIGGGIFAAFSIPFWLVGIGMAMGAVYSIKKRSSVKINRHTFELHWQCMRWSKTVTGKTEDLVNVEAHANTNMTVNNKPVVTCRITEGVRSYRFGSNLMPPERDWIVAEIEDFLTER